MAPIKSFLVGALPLLVLLSNTILPHAAKPTAPPPSPSPPPPPPPPFVPEDIPAWSSIAVEGVIYCKSCKLPGFVSSMNASPIRGAVAKLVCYKRKRGMIRSATSDANGYFRITAPDVMSFTVRKCKVRLESSPLPYCNLPLCSGPGGKGSGYSLKFEKVSKLYDGKLQAVYSAGVLMFGPNSVSECPGHR